MKIKEKMYTQKELIEFGEYLLSLKREQLIKLNKLSTYTNRKRNVYDADIANWEHTQKVL